MRNHIASLVVVVVALVAGCGSDECAPPAGLYTAELVHQSGSCTADHLAAVEGAFNLAAADDAVCGEAAYLQETDNGDCVITLSGTLVSNGDGLEALDGTLTLEFVGCTDSTQDCSSEVAATWTR